MMSVEKLEAASAEEAQRTILALIKECAEGVSDREEELLFLALSWDLDEEWLVQGFAGARRDRALFYFGANTTPGRVRGACAT